MQALVFGGDQHFIKISLNFILSDVGPGPPSANCRTSGQSPDLHQSPKVGSNRPAISLPTSAET